MSIAATGSAHRPVGMMRLMAWFVAALLAAVLAGGFLQQKEERYFAALSEADNTAKTELLLAAMLEDIITEDRARLETTVELYQESDPNFHAFAATDEDGNPLLSWQRTNVLEPQKVLMFFTRLYPRQRSVVPVTFEGENYGMITVEWNQTALGVQRDSHTYVMGTVVAILCLVFALVGYRIGRRNR